MTYDPERHHRRSIRLRGYDYAQAGAYCVTLCTHGRACLFGEVVDAEVRLSPLGAIVADEWLRTPSVRPHVDLDAFVVMPNHLHGIILLIATAKPAHITTPTTTPRGPSRPAGPAPGSLGAIVGQFKSIVTKHANALPDGPFGTIWQRNYYEQIIRHDRALEYLRTYIATNPSSWPVDQLHPDVPSRW